MEILYANIIKKKGIEA